MAEEINQNSKKINFLKIIGNLALIAALSLTIVFIYYFYRFKNFSFKPLSSSPLPSNFNFSQLVKKDFKKFNSREELLDYLKMGGESEGLYLDLGLRQPDLTIAPTFSEGLKSAVSNAPQRISETNVQVKGVDEPDIVKTNGREIFFSGQNYYWAEEMPIIPGQKAYAPPPYENAVNVIKAYPVAELAKEGKINNGGDLLLWENILMIFTQGRENKIYGYDISDPKNPSEKWQISLKDNNFLITSRLYKNKVYFVTQNYLSRSNPCPFIPLSVNNNDYSINCQDVYHPEFIFPVNATFTAFILNPENGQLEKSLSFVGSSSQSVIYMSTNSLYAAFIYYKDPLQFIYNFFKDKGSDLIPSETLARLEKIRQYDLSNQAKIVEWQQILEDYLKSLSSDERLRFENEMQNRLSDYAKEHRREVEKTGLVKISLNDFSVAATGEIPGKPLNQFSLDEYENNLRIATTVGSFNFIAANETANDVYVLDANLNPLGSIQDLGLNERIYSARFLGNKGYLVTFRQTDPFYVLDLSDPKNPKVSGELKIPGFSSYLHPLDENHILGVGREEAKVKLSLFDVKNPQNPNEISKYLLDEYWTDVQGNHHAFLQDDKHQVFFLPASRGGYIFSYQNNDLLLKKALNNPNVKRAIYIDNYLYIIAGNKIVVLDENSWEEIKSLDI